jgi:formate dehydrogenase major subunit
VPGLGATYGRGAATTFQRDLFNSDCIVIMGSNMAEAHPVGFRWPLKAKERGAVLIHIDPRFTRTSAMADVFVAIRTGTDIAFLGGIINYIIEHNRWFDEYVRHYTNASFLVRREYLGPERIYQLRHNPGGTRTPTNEHSCRHSLPISPAHTADAAHRDGLLH